MLRPALLISLLALPTVASAQAKSDAPPQTVRSVALNPGQACPKAADPNEVVVCYVEDEPFRIPKTLRNKGPIAAQNQSWVNRAATIDQVSRMAGGLPNTCSAIGSGGMTGCSIQAAQQWAAERREQKREAASVP